MTTEETRVLLRNMGIAENFLDVFKVENEVYTIRKEKIRKVASENAVFRIPLDEEKIRYREEEEINYHDDSDVFKNEENNQGFGADRFYPSEECEMAEEEPVQPRADSSCLNLFYACSQNQMDNLNRLVSNINSEKEKVLVKAYKSKLKSKFYRVYEENSQQFKEKIKHKIFHKCNYPSCGRTFASAGWLKSHFQEHLKEIKKNKFNILFENFLLKYDKKKFPVCN